MARQELDCSNCDQAFTFNMSFQRDGNFRIVCPYCGHSHYRIIRDGRVTGDRWASSSMPYQNIDTMKVPTRRPRKVRQIYKPAPAPSFIPWLGPIARSKCWYTQANASSSTNANTWTMTPWSTSGTA